MCAWQADADAQAWSRCLCCRFQIMWHDGQHLLSLSKTTLPPPPSISHPTSRLAFCPSGTCHLFMFPYPFMPLPLLRERNKQTDVFFSTTCKPLHLLISAVPSAACVQAHVHAHHQWHWGFSNLAAIDHQRFPVSRLEDRWLAIVNVFANMYVCVSCGLCMSKWVSVVYKVVDNRWPLAPEAYVHPSHL